MRRESMDHDRWMDDSREQGAEYTVLGLGDTNYDSYQGNPRRLDSYMARLGATPFYARGEADEATGYVCVSIDSSRRRRRR